MQGEAPSAKLSFVSVGCNCNAHAACWGINGLVAYGAHNLIALYSPQDTAILHTLRGHKDRVNAVAWIKSASLDSWKVPEIELVSASSDTLLIIWKRVDESWQATAVLKGHTGPVTAVAAIVWPEDVPERGGELWLASTSADRTLKIWKRSKKGEWSLSQSLSFSPNMMQCAAFTLLPTSPPSAILACGGVDSNIHLYVSDGSQFFELVSLEGHEDWVRSLSFAQDDNGDTMLASSAQDNFIRLWKFRRTEQGKEKEKEIELSEDIVSAQDISQHRGKFFRLKDTMFNVALESILYGHEDWVYSILWHPVVEKDGKKHQPHSLLSASMDRTMMIWSPDQYVLYILYSQAYLPNSESGVWLNEIRVGEMGGNTLGSYGGLFSPDGSSILAFGYNGAFHLWAKKSATSSEGQDNSAYGWAPQVTVSGHFGEVMEVMWDPTFSYLVSVSKDQTARLFAPWVRSPKKAEQDKEKEPSTEKIDDIVTWHEIARPQIHGYDLSCMSFVLGTNNRFVCGADEKVIRVFDGPQTFLASLDRISHIKLEGREGVAIGANVPPLGLSNKPVFTEEELQKILKEDRGLHSEMPAIPVAHSSPPYEETLMQSTLWPEIQKLYGHGDNLICVTSNRKGSKIASACKGAKPTQCGVIIWDTATWKQQSTLQSHTLTVTQLEFSLNDDYLLSVSRDRHFCLWKVDKNSATPDDYTLIQKQKAHDRIIWGISWSPDDEYFATASRDKKIKIWKQKEGPKESWGLDSSLTFKGAVTAVSFLPTKGTTWKYLLAVGMENGTITLWTATPSGDKGLQWNSYLAFPAPICHVATVRRLRWRPTPQQAGKFDLATCSTDHSVRLYTVSLADNAAEAK